MFKFTEYEVLHDDAQVKADSHLEGLKKEFTLTPSLLIENLLTLGEINSFKALEAIASIFKTENQRLGLVVLPHANYLVYSKEDIEIQLDNLGMSKVTSNIPYVTWSFPEDYDNPHGISYQHVYLVFVTKHKEFKEAEECIAYFIDKFNRIGAFT